MGKLHVWEETGDIRRPKEGEHVDDGKGGVLVARFDFPKTEATILRRLPDEEVEQRLVAATRTIAVDTDRARFIRETAARFMARLTGDVDECVAEAVHAAESLAAKVFKS